jgi:hypothetical protein
MGHRAHFKDSSLAAIFGNHYYVPKVSDNR